MPKPLSIDRAVHGNLKPVKDSDGTLTALEVSTDTVRIKNLEVLGDIAILGDSVITGDTNIAGEILGYTRIQNQSTVTGQAHITINTSSMTVLSTLGATTLSIQFIVPPSGNVEISCSFNMTATSDGAKFSLSTATSYAELDETHTYDSDYTIFYDETDHDMNTIRFAVTGLTAGTDTTYYLAGLASGALVTINHGRNRTAGTFWPPIILKAVALPATIVTGQ